MLKLKFKKKITTVGFGLIMIWAVGAFSARVSNTYLYARIYFLETELTNAFLAEDIYRLVIKKVSEEYPWVARPIADVIEYDPDVISMIYTLKQLELKHAGEVSREI